MRQAFYVGGILLLTFLIFLPTLHYALVYDDFEQIVTNPRITSWSYLGEYFTTHLWAHSPLEPAYYYRPFFLIFLRLVYATLGPPGAIWHLASILAHLGATVSVLLLIRRLTGDRKAALLSAALFAIHPIHTEAVAWVSSVSEPLLTISVVLCVYFYVGRKGPVSLASLLFATLAMFTKETGLVIPALIFAYEWLQARVKDAVSGAAPYLVPALFFLFLRLCALGKFNTAAVPNMSVSGMILTWPRVLAAYTSHLLWPVHLSVCYDVPVETTIWQLLALMVVVAALIWVCRNCGENVRLGAAWFAITLLPALGIRYLLTDDYVHDRYLYLPSVGLALLASAGFSRLRLTSVKMPAVGVVVLTFCLGTTTDLRIWQNNETLFRRAVETAPQNPRAINNLADAYLNSHREAEALPLLEKVIAMRPLDHQGYYNLFRYYRQTGNYAEAERYYDICERIYHAERTTAGGVH
jgi:hypothetical protein